MLILPPPGPWPTFMPKGGVSDADLENLDRFLFLMKWYIAFLVVSLLCLGVMIVRDGIEFEKHRHQHETSHAWTRESRVKQEEG